MVLVQLSYDICRRLPTSERHVLADQLRRSSTSILLNIAEGTGSGTDKEFLRYLYIARKSLFETIALLKFVEKEYTDIGVSNIFYQCDTVGKLLNGMIKHLKANS